MTGCRTLGAAALLACLPAICGAQTIRGVVVDRSDAPVAGVLVVLLEGTSSVAARSLSNARGEFRLAASRAGVYRVITQRTGFRPVTSDPVTLVAAQEVTQRIVLTGSRVSLDTVRVAGRSACRILKGDSSTITFTIWEQVRSALTMAELAARQRTFSATTVAYERTLDPNGRRVRQQTSRIGTGFVAQPWRELTPDSLHRGGYVATEADGTMTYQAPGFDALLSTVFIEDHCFRLVAFPGTTVVGIAFEPTPDRHAIPEIAGTIWLDRASSELRSLEFRYVNLGGELEGQSGGLMAFVRMTSGMWAISQWSIRIPVLERVIRTRSAGGDQARVVEIKVSGGELALVRSGADTLWSRPPLAMTGVVTDSASGSTIAAARISLRGTPSEAVTDARGRFTIPAVLPGEYTVDVRTASLDSVSAVHQSLVVFADSTEAVTIRVPDAQHVVETLCGGGRATTASPTGVIVGRVSVRGDAVPVAAFGNVKIVAEWTVTSLRSDLTAAGVGRPVQWTETRADARGTFRMCGVPVNTAILLQTAADSGSAEPLRFSILPNRRFVRADPALERNVDRGAVFMGTVFVDSTRVPIPDVEVALPVLAMSVRTNDRGGFRITSIPPGSHQTVARRLGFGPVDTNITFEANQIIERNLLLSRVTVIDSVFVTASRPVPGGFEDNRKLGLGQFLTRAELSKMEDRSFSEVLRQLPGLRVVSGRANRAWIASTRGARGGKCVEREGGDADCNCYAQVYLDDQPLYRGNQGGMVPDVNRVAPAQIEAIEYYAGPAQTPARYSSPNSTCGVLVIWTRRRF